MTTIDQTKLIGVTLTKGGHDTLGEGLCLMEATR